MPFHSLSLSQESYKQWALGFGVKETLLAREKLLARFPWEFWNSVCRWESEFLRRKVGSAPQVTSGKRPKILTPVWLLLHCIIPAALWWWTDKNSSWFSKENRIICHLSAARNPVIIGDRVKGMASNWKGTGLDGILGINYLSWGWWGPGTSLPEKLWMSHFPEGCRAVRSGWCKKVERDWTN